MGSATASPPIDPTRALELCRLLADPTRFTLMAAIWKVERCVCELQFEVRRPQNLVSHHLGTLRRAGLVQSRRDKRWTYYRPADNLEEDSVRVLESLLGPRGFDRTVCEPTDGVEPAWSPPIMPKIRRVPFLDT
jgi:ArsR family transcriptional regulator